MMIERILEAAKPHLEGKKVSELVVGLSMIGCCLSDGKVGVAYMLRDSLPNGCSAFPYAQEVEGKPAEEIAKWVMTGADDAQRGIGAAVLSAASQSLDIPDDDSPQPFGVEIRPGDVIGMVGYIRPVAQRLKKIASEVLVFDWGVEQAGGDDEVTPCALQDQLLPKCDVVILSGTTTINGSIDGLLDMCTGAREIVLVGSSTPMFSAAFEGTGVTHLAGAWWKNEEKDKIFKIISQAGGIRALSEYIIMKNAPVE